MGDNDHQCSQAAVISKLATGEDFMKEQLARLEKGQATTQELLVKMGNTLVGMAHTQESVKRIFGKLEEIEIRITAIEKKPGEKALKIQNMIEVWVIRAFVAGGLIYFFADKI